MSGLFPSITITDITAFATGGTWTASVAGGYTVGLIPGSSGSSELSSVLAAPQGDIYDAAAGAAGNSIATFVATSAPPAFSGLEGQAFGDFIFAAASPVPVPAAIWLFGSGLVSLAGVARRKNSA